MPNPEAGGSRQSGRSAADILEPLVRLTVICVCMVVAASVTTGLVLGHLTVAEALSGDEDFGPVGQQMGFWLSLIPALAVGGWAAWVTWRYAYRKTRSNPEETFAEKLSLGVENATWRDVIMGIGRTTTLVVVLWVLFEAVLLWVT